MWGWLMWLLTTWNQWCTAWYEWYYSGIAPLQGLQYVAVPSAILGFVIGMAIAAEEEKKSKKGLFWKSFQYALEGLITASAVSSALFLVAKLVFPYIVLLGSIVITLVGGFALTYYGSSILRRLTSEKHLTSVDRCAQHSQEACRLCKTTANRNTTGGVVIEGRGKFPKRLSIVK